VRNIIGLKYAVSAIVFLLLSRYDFDGWEDYLVEILLRFRSKRNLNI